MSWALPQSETTKACPASEKKLQRGVRRDENLGFVSVDRGVEASIPRMTYRSLWTPPSPTPANRRRIIRAARYRSIGRGTQVPHRWSPWRPARAWETQRVRFVNPPRSACWHHEGLRLGFEVTYFTTAAGGVQAEGTAAGLQGGDTWIVSYRILLDESGRTRMATLTSQSASGRRERLLEADGVGHWSVDGKTTNLLDGCLDVDLEASAMTNALPVRRLALAVGERAAAPAGYDPCSDLGRRTTPTDVRPSRRSR